MLTRSVVTVFVAVLVGAGVDAGSAPGATRCPDVTATFPPLEDGAIGGTAQQLQASRVPCATAQALARGFLLGPCRAPGWTVSGSPATTTVLFRRGSARVRFTLLNEAQCSAELYPTYRPPPTFLPSRCVDHRLRPRTVVVACGDGYASLIGLRWRRWGFAEATATGTARLNDCIPYCARGTYRLVRARARAYDLRYCHGARWQYARLRYELIGSLPSAIRGARRRVTVKFGCP
jgi:hypothetical protein